MTIDQKIANLIYEMNKVGLRTACSCQGHNGNEAYVSIPLSKDIRYLYRKDIFGEGLDELVIYWKPTYE